MAQWKADRAMGDAIGHVYEGMAQDAITALLETQDGSAPCADMVEMTIDGTPGDAACLVNGDRIQGLANVYWTQRLPGGRELPCEATADVDGRIVDGTPVVERIFVVSLTD